MLYRKVDEQDVPQITELYNWYITNGVESFETEPLPVGEMRRRVMDISSRFPYYVAVEEGRVEGYCYAHQWKERAAYAHTFETTIYLRPSAKRQGIGTALMELLIADCRAMGCRALIACITGENTSSIAFHSRLGFERASLFRSVGYKMGRWLDVVDMELLLW
jgi:L-amino acid N-acyltransferase YncA